jgi:hypothetical protein
MIRFFKQLTLAALALLVAAASALGGAAASGTPQKEAGLVIQFADGSLGKFCIPFEGESISGLEMLQKSGLPLKFEGFGGMGALVCKIGPDGCDYPGEQCACKSYGPGGVYWTYHHLRGTAWKVSAMGAGGYRVKPGEVDGWAWSAGKPPPVHTFEQLCPAGGVLAPTPTPVPVEPALPPQPTATLPRPTRTAATRPAAPRTPTRSVAPSRTPTRPRPTATQANTPLPTRTRASTSTRVRRTPTVRPPTRTRTSTSLPTRRVSPTVTSTPVRLAAQSETIGVNWLAVGAARVFT